MYNIYEYTEMPRTGTRFMVSDNIDYEKININQFKCKFIETTTDKKEAELSLSEGITPSWDEIKTYYKNKDVPRLF